MTKAILIDIGLSILVVVIVNLFSVFIGNEFPGSTTGFTIMMVARGVLSAIGGLVFILVHNRSDVSIAYGVIMAILTFFSPFSLIIMIILNAVFVNVIGNSVGSSFLKKLKKMKQDMLFNPNYYSFKSYDLENNRFYEEAEEQQTLNIPKYVYGNQVIKVQKILHDEERGQKCMYFSNGKKIAMLALLDKGDERLYIKSLGYDQTINQKAEKSIFDLIQA